MDYQEALKKVTAEKPKDNFIVITLSYDTKLVLPYKEGVEIVKAMNSAEVMATKWGKPGRITPITKDTTTVSIMSNKEYLQLKMAALLNVTLEELTAMETT